MPICVMCHEAKPTSDFAFRSMATGELNSHCRECHAAYRRDHYLRNKATYIENERLRVRGHRERNRRLLVAYLLEHPCVDCGEPDPVVLDFDHRDPQMKRSEVSMLAARKPWSAVLLEIAKCDVRCVNCHRKRTAEQFNWRRGSRGVHEVAEAERRSALPHPPISGAPDELRQCHTCHRLLPMSEFALKNAHTGRRSWKCKACQRAYAKRHYDQNRGAYLAKSRRRNAVERERFAAMILNYLTEHPCVDCGEADLRVLEFDHRDAHEKLATVNALLRSWNWDAALAEIAKCDVRCGNCHRRRTAKQLGWKRLELVIAAA